MLLFFLTKKEKKETAVLRHLRRRIKIENRVALVHFFNNGKDLE